MECARRMGRNPKRWFDCVERDLRTFQIRSWKIKALKTVLQRDVVGEVRARNRM
jgi:hypothetical protein